MKLIILAESHENWRGQADGHERIGSMGDTIVFFFCSCTSDQSEHTINKVFSIYLGFYEFIDIAYFLSTNVHCAGAALWAQ